MSKLLFCTLYLLFSLPVCAQVFSGGDGDGGANAMFSGAASLPLTLVDFTATAREQTVELRWITYDEDNTETMIVERATDGTRFAEIGSLPAAGDARGRRLTYAFTDAVPLPGVSYYRLRVVDFDGALTLSAVVSVSRDAAPTPSFSLYPNPTNGAPPTLSVPDSGAKGNTHVTVYDLHGRKLLHFDLPGTGGPAQLPALRVGTYRVQLRSADGKHSTQTLLVTPAP